MARKLDKVGVALCADLKKVGELDPAAIGDCLEQSEAGVQVEVVPDLCRRPNRTRELVARTGARRLVIGLCAQRAAAHEFHRWARRAGLDQFALELVSLGQQTNENGGTRATDTAILRLRAAIARVRVFEGSEPDQLKLRFLHHEQALSRRSLMVLPPWTYEAVPSIDRERCVGDKRCGLCISTCPLNVVNVRDGYPVVDKADCESCGLCITACPLNAIRCPGSSLSQYEAELAVLLASGPAGIVFVNRQSATALEHERNGRMLYPEGWLPVEVPCIEMVTTGWVLQAFAAGATAVSFVPCREGCRCHREPALEGRVAYVRELLHLLGEERATERMRMLPAEPEELARVLDGCAPAKLAPVGRAPRDHRPEPPARGRAGDGAAAPKVTLAEPAATAQAVLKLAEGYGAGQTSLSLAHEASPLGTVSVAQETCTMCGACTAVCPTSALNIKEDAGALALHYDATRCIYCQRCGAACPEANTLSVSGTTDLAALARGDAILKSGAIAVCKSCGVPVAPVATLNRVQALLQDESKSTDLLAALTEYCPDCRVVRAGAER